MKALSLLKKTELMLVLIKQSFINKTTTISFAIHPVSQSVNHSNNQSYTPKELRAVPGTDCEFLDTVIHLASRRRKKA